MHDTHPDHEHPHRTPSHGSLRVRPPLLLALLLPALFLALSSCDDDTTRPSDDGFSIAVEVRDPAGDPVEGLEVVVWNMSSSLEVALQDDFFGSSLARRRAATDVRFELPERSECDFTVSDLEGRIVHSVLSGDTLEAGAHSLRIGVDIDYRAGVEVYRYELIARDPATDEEFFRDERLMTAVHLDRTRLRTGTTDASGRWSTDDPTYVPGLYDLGTMPLVDETGEQRGSFSVADTLVVRVYDDAGAYLQRSFPVDDATNLLKLTWDVTVLRRDDPDGVEGVDVVGDPAPWAPAEAAMDAPVPPIEFRLRQNAPNPFN